MHKPSCGPRDGIGPEHFGYWGCSKYNTHYWPPLRLLGARREWPRHRCAASKGYELPPSHLPHRVLDRASPRLG